MDKTCITGATAMDMDQMKKVKKVTIDGSTGKVWLDKEVPVIDGCDSAEIGTVMDAGVWRCSAPAKSPRSTSAWTARTG